MGKYRRRSVEVDAFCFGHEPQPQWFIDATTNGTTVDGISAFRVKSTGRLLKARNGDYFIRYDNSLWVCEGSTFPALYMVSVNLEPEYSGVNTEDDDAIVNAGAWAIIGFGILSIGLGYSFGAGVGWMTAGIGCIGMATLIILHARQIARKR